MVLAGTVPDRLAGQNVEVEGTRENLGSFLMTGDPVLLVTAVKPV